MELFQVIRDFGVFPSALLLGLGLGAVYDALRVVRAILPHGGVLLFFEDLFYVMFFWFCMFTFSVGAVGEIRYYITAGLLLGALAERFAAGRFIVALAEKISDLVRKRLIYPPIRFVAKAVGKIRSVFVKSA